MKFKLIILIIPILLLFSSCRAEEEKTDTENEKETLIMAYPSEVEDYYFNSFQQSESNELIAMFNQKSEDFIIQKQEYESYDKLLMDILSGRSFDLLYVGGCNTAIVGMKRQNGGTGIGYSRIYEIDGSDYVYDMKGVTEFVFDENGAARGYEASDNSAVKKALKNFSEKNI